MALDSAKNVNLMDITVVHSHITGVYYATSDVPTPVPETIPEMTEGYNAETEEGGEESNDKYKTGAVTPPQIRINE